MTWSGGAVGQAQIGWSNGSQELRWMTDLKQTAKQTASADAGGGEAGVGDDRGKAERLRWLPTWATAFVLLFGLAACWSIATPMFASPDEATHMVRATAVAHGELFGTKVSDATVRVRVPAGIAREVAQQSTCFELKPSQHAGCAPTPNAGGALGYVSITTYVGHYPPLYYGIVGLPTLFTDQTVALYLMRLVSAALSAAFLAAAFAAAVRATGFVFAPFGVALAASPMAFFLAGMVNPNGLEISAAICMWSTALAVAGSREIRRSGFLIGWLATSTGVLVQTRGLSPIFASAAAVGIVLLFGWRVWGDVGRQLLAKAGVVFVGLCSLFALGWFVVIDPTRITPATTGPVSTRGVALLSSSFHHYAGMIPQMVGTFGWLDTPSPQPSYDIWYAVLCLAVLFAAARRWWRGLGVLMLLLAANVALPVFAISHAAHRYGLVGQGRDWLPLAVSVPLVAAYSTRRLVPGDRPLTATSATRVYYSTALLVAAATLALATAELGGFLNALHRYRNGLGHAFKLFGPAGWTPPVSPVVVVLAAVLLELAWCAWAGGATVRALIRAGAQRTATRAFAAADPSQTISA